MYLRGVLALQGTKDRRRGNLNAEIKYNLISIQYVNMIFRKGIINICIYEEHFSAQRAVAAHTFRSKVQENVRPTY